MLFISTPLISLSPFSQPHLLLGHDGFLSLSPRELIVLFFCNSSTDYYDFYALSGNLLCLCPTCILPPLTIIHFLRHSRSTSRTTLLTRNTGPNWTLSGNAFRAQITIIRKVFLKSFLFLLFFLFLFTVFVILLLLSLCPRSGSRCSVSSNQPLLNCFGDKWFFCKETTVFVHSRCCLSLPLPSVPHWTLR